MANNPVQKTVKTLPNSFYIPDGVTEFEYGDVDDVFVDGDTTTDENVSDLSDILVDYDVSVVLPDNLIPIPENVTILSQTMRTAPGGQQVVDLIIQVDDIDGVDHFEPRATKV